jgi:hypothetical protein
MRQGLDFTGVHRVSATPILCRVWKNSDSCNAHCEETEHGLLSSCLLQQSVTNPIQQDSSAADSRLSVQENPSTYKTPTHSLLFTRSQACNLSKATRIRYKSSLFFFKLILILRHSHIKLYRKNIKRPKDFYLKVPILNGPCLQRKKVPSSFCSRQVSLCCLVIYKK